MNQNGTTSNPMSCPDHSAGQAEPAPATQEATREITDVLNRCKAGDDAAHADLFRLVYDELRVMAIVEMQHERKGHTLQPTALVHEAYMRLMRLLDPQGPPVDNRSHFFGSARNAMHEVLANYARYKNALKRKPPGLLTSLDKAAGVAARDDIDLSALREALGMLAQEAKEGAKQAKVVELRFYHGLDDDAIAKELGITPRHVRTSYETARAWLRAYMGAQ